jgi:cytochrome c5
MRNLLLAALTMAALCAGAPQQGVKPAAAAANPNQALVNRYCVTCHNQKLRTAKLALDTLLRIPRRTR